MLAGRGVACETKAHRVAVKVLHPASYGNKRALLSFPAICCEERRFFMSKNKKNARIALFGSLKVMTMSAMLCAMSVVIGIICKNFLNFGGGLFRITFENLPIILSGVMFGPVVGGIVGLATDIISYLLSNQEYPINLVVTLGATLIGVISGFLSRYVLKKKGYARIVFSATAAHILGSMIVKTIGLYSYWGVLTLWRVPTYIVICSVEIVIICLMYKNPYIKKLIDSSTKS